MTKQYLDDVFGPAGYLAARFEGYEARPGQVQMASLVDSVIEDGGHAVIEGPCGVGKSLGYCVPATYYAYNVKAKVDTDGTEPKTVVIVTENLALQEQLCKKDLPMLADLLPWTFKFAQLKGRGNFLCPFKVEGHETRQEAEGVDRYTFGLTDPEHINQAHILMAWSKMTNTTGDRSDGFLLIEPDPQVWAQFIVDKNECNGKKCRHYDKCPYYKARNLAWKADIIVTNYHLLMAHIQVREKTEKDLVLPAIDTLICDEAHEMEHIARSALGFTLAPTNFRRLLRYAQDIGQGKLHEEIRRVRDAFFEPAKYRNDVEQVAANKLRYDKHYTVYRNGVTINGDGIDEIFRQTQRSMEPQEEAQKFCDDVAAAIAKLHGGSQRRLSKLLHDPDLLHPESLLNVIGMLKQLAVTEVARIEKWKEQLGGKLPAGEVQKLGEAEGVIRTITDLSEKIVEFSQQSDADKAYWIDASKYNNVQLVAAQIDVAAALQEKLYSHVRSIVFTSATLSTGGHFKYIEETLGLHKPKALIAASPFNHFDQSLFITPAPGTVPELPNSPEFDTRSVELFKQVIDAASGRTLGLFTRLESMHKVANGLRDDQDCYNGFHVLVQGELDRNMLVEAFRDDESSVLLGVKSFWQGIDVPGDSLSAVVIHKLPFPVPDDPIVEAVHERLGTAAFGKFDLPRMLMSVRQGVGRLIRRKDDVGVIVVFDRRVWSKSYGIDLCQSLPRMRPWVQDLGAIQPWLEEARTRIPREASR